MTEIDRLEAVYRGLSAKAPQSTASIAARVAWETAIVDETKEKLYDEAP